MTDDGSSSFKELQSNVTAGLIDTTRTVTKLASEDLAFVRSTNPEIARALDKQNDRLLVLIRRLTANATVSTDIPTPSLPNVEALDENWPSVVDVLDSLLEKSDTCLDEFTGVLKRLSPPQKTTAASLRQGRGAAEGKAHKGSDIPKPQLSFKRVPKNDETTAFKPLLRSKPHAIVSLEESIVPVATTDGLDSYKHPYVNEITQSEYSPATYMKQDPIPARPFDTTTATFVETPEAVQEMLKELKQVKQIAVDLEHHDIHSYIGIVSLMQISTRDKDYIVDTLKPWREDLQVLNEVFADPNIIKVLHGAFMDIIWLQRDLGIYVVGLFDTYHASHALGYPRHSLAYLLEYHCKFLAQKKYQMADWRTRPLPKEMFEYARSDTHFLLYIFDNLRNELIDKSGSGDSEGNLITRVLEDSKKEALQRYERPFYDARQGIGTTGWYNMLIKTPALFSKEQFSVFKAVHRWRDTVARREDESLSHVMPKTVVFNIARELPMDIPQLLGCSHPISAIVRRNQDELLAVVRKARAEGPSGPEMKEFLAEHPATKEWEAEKARRLEAWKSQQAMQNSVAQVLLQERAVQDGQNLRSKISHFWGSLWGSTNGKRHYGTPANDPTDSSVTLTLPLPHLTAEIYASNEAGPEAPAADPITTSDAKEPRASHEYTNSRNAREPHIFTIKELSGPRKRRREEAREAPAATNNSATPAQHSTPQAPADLDADVMDIDPEDAAGTPERRAAEKAELRAARAARKAAKKERREKAAQEAGGEAEGEELVPFDYANAPSVLNPKREDGPGGGRKKGDAGKAFNPYAKALDASQGARKPRRSEQGRSMTFKS